MSKMTYERFTEIKEVIKYISEKLDSNIAEDNYTSLESRQLISHLSSTINILNKEMIGE